MKTKLLTVFGALLLSSTVVKVAKADDPNDLQPVNPVAALDCSNNVLSKQAEAENVNRQIEDLLNRAPNIAIANLWGLPGLNIRLSALEDEIAALLSSGACGPVGPSGE